LIFVGHGLPGTKLEEMITGSFNFFDSSLGGKIPRQYDRVCIFFAERRVLVIIVMITMDVFLDKQTEVMQTLLSMIEPTENERGCRSCHVFIDIEEKNVFSLIEEWETREDLEDHIKSDRFSVLLGTKSLLCEPPQIQIHTVSHSEGMETVTAARHKKNLTRNFKI
jgi:quinol monooxygenase YgiN